jgi:energy-coupling factor transporter ATP-binding protein EcfA2
MDYIKKITVSPWKHIRLDRPIELESGINLILGKNGSGKTSLINMIQAAATNQEQSLQPAAQSEFPEGARLCSIELQSGAADVIIDNKKNGNQGQWSSNELSSKLRIIGSARSVTSGTNTKNPFATNSLNFDISNSVIGQTIDVAEEFNKSIINELLDVIKAKMEQGTDYLGEIQKDYQNWLVDFDKTLVTVHPSGMSFGQGKPVRCATTASCKYSSTLFP